MKTVIIICFLCALFLAVELGRELERAESMRPQPVQVEVAPPVERWRDF